MQTKTGFHITSLEQSHGRWSWMVGWDHAFEADTYQWHSGPVEARRYRTNGQGKGLWILGADRDWHQVQGTSQFELDGSPGTVRARIRRYFAST
jgi:hypothetical protein